MIDVHDLLIAGRMTGSGSGGTSVLIEKSVTANGTYSAADDNADGYSAVTVAVPQRAANGAIGTQTNNGSIFLPGVQIDQTARFEAVICFYVTNEWLDYAKYLMCGSYDTDSFYIALDAQGAAYFQFFWGHHDWSSTSERAAIHDDGTHIVRDGTTPNYLKAEKTTDNRLVLSHSTDGKTFAAIAETNLPDNMNNLRTAGDIYLGCGGNVGTMDATRYIEHINIFNCCFKQNGTVLWGREIE